MVLALFQDKCNFIRAEERQFLRGLPLLNRNISRYPSTLTLADPFVFIELAELKLDIVELNVHIFTPARHAFLRLRQE